MLSTRRRWKLLHRMFREGRKSAPMFYLSNDRMTFLELL